jgi:hypothetical protein
MRRLSRFPALLLAGLFLPILAGSVRAHGPLHGQIERLDRAIRADPDNARLRLERAELHRIDENPGAALRDLEAAARLDPGLHEVDLCRAALDYESGRPEAALLVVDRYLSRVPDHGEALRLKARIELSLERPAEALASFVAALAHLERTTPDDYQERARLQKAAGQDGAAVDRELALSIERLRSGALEPRAPEEPQAPAATTLIPRTATWKYFASASDLGTAWRAPAYADGSWPSGPAILGFGDPFITTTIPYGSDPNNKWRTTYFRIPFNLADPPGTIQSLFLGANYDDGFVAYLNGQEIVRRSLPTGSIVYSTVASSHEGGAWQSIDVSSGIPWLVQGDNVLAVEVHQTSASSTDLAMGMELTATSGAPVLTRGPYLQIGTPGSIVIRWRTGAASDSRVRHGPSPANLTTVVDDPTLTTEHEVLVSGLSPDTRYYYSVGSSTFVVAGGDSSHTFVTSPPHGTDKATRIWVLGDSGNPALFSIAVRDAFDDYTGARGTDLWLMLGDNAYSTGTDTEYQAAVFDTYPEHLKKSVLWPTRGNHDVIHAGGNNDYYDIFSMPTAGEAGGVASLNEAYYSFDYANIHFICLDSEGSSRAPGSPMLTWLDDDLEASAQDWTIAYWHHPPYSKGSHDSDNAGDSGGRMRDMRENVLPILEAHGVDLVLTGHSHSYERTYLLDEHYGLSTTLVDSMKLDSGDGSPFGDGAYEKPGAGLVPHAGAVYTVAGSSCQTGGGSLNHPAMVTSLNVLGSVVLDVNDLQLDAVFLDNNRVIRDRFTIVKSSQTAVQDGSSPAPRHPVNHPNPFTHKTRIDYTVQKPGPVSFTIHDVNGRRVATLVREFQDKGTHEITWDGLDDGGEPLSPGVYFGVLRAGGKTETRKLVLAR